MTDLNIRKNFIFNKFKDLSESNIKIIEKVVDILLCPKRINIPKGSFMIEKWSEAFCDLLITHHAFSNEPFTKDKLEHALVNSAHEAKLIADLATRGNKGHDIQVKGQKISLKTQADRKIKVDSIWISKYMELGKGVWTDKIEDLYGLTDLFLNHLSESDKIWVLRCLTKAPFWKYELIEIPKSLLLMSKNGNFDMKQGSKQFPKPGYCHVTDQSGNNVFSLYFDGGSERKLQIKDLKKIYCTTIGQWEFDLSNF